MILELTRSDVCPCAKRHILITYIMGTVNLTVVTCPSPMAGLRESTPPHQQHYHAYQHRDNQRRMDANT